MSLHAAGRLPSVESAALGYWFEGLPLSPNQDFRDRLFMGLPLWTQILTTPWGTIGQILLPRHHSELYADPQALVEEVIDALELARRMGARRVSLQGLLPSATEFGAVSSG